MPNSYACEGNNGTIVSVYPNDFSAPHVAVALSHLRGIDNQPVLAVARLSPDDARAVAVALTSSADRVQVSYDEWMADAKADIAFEYDE